MRRKTILAALLVFMAQAVAVEQSQKQPPPTGERQPRVADTQGSGSRSVAATESNSEPPKPPSVINEGQSEEENSATAGTGNGTRNDVASNNDPIITYTFWLTVFTGGLTLFTAVLAGATIYLYVVTKRAANAASKSADALPLVERAYIITEITKSRNLADTREGFTDFEVTVVISNHGRTPARLTLLRGLPVLQEKVPIELPSFTNSDRGIPDGIVIGATKNYEVSIVRRFVRDEISDIGGGRKTLFYCGLVKYMDVLNQERETGYCWQLRMRADGRQDFVITPDTPLNRAT